MPLTKQEIFDKAYKGVIEQGGPSILPGVDVKCRYRDRQGRKCALGHCIPDEKYMPEFEHLDLLGVHAIVKELSNVGAVFLADLRNCHDNSAYLCRDEEDFLNRFRTRCQKFAKRYKLEVPEV